MKFSIITIAYNSGETIERTINSVLLQTTNDYEYIIVDGASKDGTLEIIKKYEPFFDGRMKWRSEPDTGIYNAMNKGLLRASGDLIGIVNSDDWLEPDALETVERVYEDNNYDNNTLYCGSIKYHNTVGVAKERKVNLLSFKWQARLLYVMSGVRHPAVFVPMQIYKEIGLFNEKMHLSADQDFILRCFYGGVKFEKINKVLTNMSEGGISTEGTERSKKISEEDRKIMLREFNKQGLKYGWLWYSWKVRLWIRNIIKNKYIINKN